MVVYQIVMRTGWIFKTESSIMPAVVDALDGGAWVRGWLPLLNRFGQSVPPLLMARRIKNLPKKKHAFIATTTSMAVIFACLTAIWIIPGLDKSPSAALIYLVLYGLFFAAIGINGLSYNTIQGKLIRVTRRGRLLMIADTVGATSAVLCALLLLPRWLHADYADFRYIFGFSTLLFAVASIMAWLLKEQRDNYHEPRTPLLAPFAGAWETLRRDANFRRLCIVSALFSSSLVLFPHYQALASEKLGLGFEYLVWWVVAQNIGTAIFSILTGPLADRFGNRSSLRVLTLAICAAPQLAVFLGVAPALGKQYFAAVFLLIGMTPVAQKTFNNYTLEIANQEDHPKYLSTLSLCMAGPIFLSPLVGGMIELVGFEMVYHFITLLLVIGSLLSLGLQEPRHKSVANVVVGADESL